MRTVIQFLNTKNMKPAEIHQLCDVYGERAMSRSKVRKWMRKFHEGRGNVHDDPRSGWTSVVNEDFLRAFEEKIRENRRFKITSLSLRFPRISRSFFHEIVSDKLEFRELCACSKQTTSTRRIMCTVFWYRKGLLLVEFLPQDSTINAGVYCDTLK
jgi:hypothetical protein